MREKEIAVRFEPLGKTVYVLPGTRLIEATARVGLAINVPCGGQGRCGKCRVRVLGNPCDPTSSEQQCFSEEELADGWRLACQTALCGPCTVEVPEQSVMASTYRILAAVEQNGAQHIDPTVRKTCVTLPEPSREDPAPDLERLQRAIGPFKVDLPLLQELPARLRAGNWHGTAVMADGKLIDFEQGDQHGECYGLAFDVGTTTIVGSLLNVATGDRKAIAARMNPQTSVGDDVLSRIRHCRDVADGTRELHRAVIGAVNAMVDELLEESGVARTHIYEASFAGNTTMQQLLMGVNPAALGEMPFVPAAGRALCLASSDLGLAIHPLGRAYLFPVIGGFLGGDTVAGILATDLAQAPGPTLLIDIGTNGELVLAYDGQLVATSTAAGPAFEGARIKYGMRASSGAIEKVLFDSDVRINVIGDAAPIGLCGSALIDTVAGLLDSGLLMPEGLLLDPALLPDTTPPNLARRMTPGDAGFDFVLAHEEESGLDAPVVLTQQDVRELQLAAAAIRAGVQILLNKFGLTSPDLHRVLIAGGFGNFIRRSHAQRIGLLPADIPHDRITYVGNASLAGAQLTALSRKARHAAAELAGRAERIDLSLDPQFQMAFIEGMNFPDPSSPGEEKS